MWKLIQMIIAIFQRILDCCRRCFRRTNDEAEHLLDTEAPGLPEDTDNDDLKCKTKVEPRLGENNAEFKRELQTLREDREKLQAEVRASMGKLQEKDAEINRLQKELQTFREDREKLQAEVGASVGKLQEKDAEINRLQKELQTFREDREKLQAEVGASMGELQEKDAEIKRLQKELQALKEKELEFYQKDNKQHQDIKITAEPPKVTSQPASQTDIFSGKSVTFSVQATGTQPLDYQWQWKQFGKEGEQDGWKHLPAKGNTFQVTEVKARDAGYYRCVVSNGAASEISQCVRLTVVPEVRDLSNELKKVIDWMSFGLNLGFEVEELQTIEANYPTLQRRRLEMLNEWQKRVTPTWSAVVQELVGIGMRRLASELAQKHGAPPPKQSDGEQLHITNIPQQKEATGSKLLKEFEKRRGPLEQGRRRLANAEEQLIHSRKSKSAVNEVVNQVMCQLKELREKAQKIVQEKKILLMELESKQMELQQLSELKEKYAADIEKKPFYSAKISKKRLKIKKLEKELQRKKSNLQSALQEAQKMQKELSQAQVEMKKKDEEVKQLHEEKEKMACSFNIEQEQVSKLVQFITTLTSEKTEMEHQLSSMKEESENRLQQIESCNLKISHLSEEVKQKEATVAQLKSELRSYEQAYGTPEQQLKFLELSAQIAELEHRLQEVKEQKQQEELDKEAAVQEVDAMSKFRKLLREQIDETPKITTPPISPRQISPGNSVAFTVQATGAKPMSYQWQWRSAASEADEWQPCPAAWSNGAKVTISNPQKSNEGWYRCVISNYAGTETSRSAKLNFEPPKVTGHPKNLKEISPGKPVAFTVQATGTKPLRYQWQWRSAVSDAEDWQPCPAAWSDGAKLTISNPQKSNEGWYRCVISNYAGTETSRPAKLSFAEAPKITDHPKKLKNAIRGKSANFSVQATGTPPLTHQWQWIPSEKDEDWQPCDAKWSSGATLTIPNVQKSNEGIYRCVVSNHVGNVTSNSATLETCPLQLPLQLMWGKCKDMAYGMSEYPHSVVLHTNIYVGGGLADDVDEECTIQVYDNNKAEWSSLPRYRYRWFAMSVVNSQLTLVGGKDVSNWKVTNQLAALDTTSQCWTYPYPPMPTPRHRPAVSTYDIWLLVAGGADRRDLATVELLNISTKQWLSTSSLPMPCSRMTSTVLEDKWYLVTNSRRVFRVSLPDIVSQTVSQSADSKLPALWRRLPDTPLGYSTAIILRGSLLAVGGYHNGTRTDIYHYHPVSEKWIKVGDLPTPRHYCSCVLLSNGKLLVTGGEEISGRTRRVDIAWTH